MKLAFLICLLPVTLFAQGSSLENDDWDEESWDEQSWGEDQQGTTWHGFLEAGLGTRFDEDLLVGQRETLEEVRGRVESEWQPGKYHWVLKADVGYDGVENDWILEARDMSVAFVIGDSTDIAIGRQVQTWGTGDLVFLNDLFPKDFQSFFSGRDDEYLKAPGNAIRLTHYSNSVNVDFVWTPVFEPDVYLTGERYSFFSPLAGGNIAPDFHAQTPSETLANGEFALRLFRTIDSREFAFYAYRGFFKQPDALTPALEPTFAPMSAVGASIRQPLGPGLFNAEISYYDSRDDRSGTDPLMPNDQVRLLAGYEWEARTNFTVGLQYYLEGTLDHDELLANSPFPQYEPDELRHLITNRLTLRSAMDKYTWSLFTFYSPSDRDFYMRPQLAYRQSDQWSISAGGNLFGGEQEHTFFNQLQDASNAYVRVRYHY